MPRNEVRRRGVRVLQALGALLLAVVLACTPTADEDASTGEGPARATSTASAPAPTQTATAAVSPTPTPTATPAAAASTATAPAATATPPRAPTATATPAPTATREAIATATPAPTATREATATATPTAPTALLSLDGITVAPELCDGYDRDHFAGYNARALRDGWDADDGAADGVITGWYTGLRLANSGQAVHVEHVVALKEAWCSGYREPSLGNWPMNLRPAEASLNRSKSDRDPAEWDRPDLPGWCQYLVLHVHVKRALGMAADSAELDYIAGSWATHCGDAEAAPAAPATSTPAPTATAEAAYTGPQPARTCGEFGWRVDRRTHPNLYAALDALGMRDGNSDGIMCNAERAYRGPDYPAP